MQLESFNGIKQHTHNVTSSLGRSYSLLSCRLNPSTESNSDYYLHLRRKRKVLPVSLSIRHHEDQLKYVVINYLLVVLDRLANHIAERYHNLSHLRYLRNPRIQLSTLHYLSHIHSRSDSNSHSHNERNPARLHPSNCCHSASHSVQLPSTLGPTDSCRRQISIIR